MEKRKSIYELLIRWGEDGTIKGAHVSYLEQIIDDDGTTVIAVKQTPAESIALASQDLADVLNQVQIDALNQIDILGQQVVEKDDIIEQLQQQIAQLSGQ